MSQFVTVASMLNWSVLTGRGVYKLGIEVYYQFGSVYRSLERFLWFKVTFTDVFASGSANYDFCTLAARDFGRIAHCATCPTPDIL